VFCDLHDPADKVAYQLDRMLVGSRNHSGRDDEEIILQKC
jgi:hypothetical protein